MAIEAGRGASQLTRKVHAAVEKFTDADWDDEVELLDGDIDLVSSDGEHEAIADDSDSDNDNHPSLYHEAVAGREQCG